MSNESDNLKLSLLLRENKKSSDLQSQYTGSCEVGDCAEELFQFRGMVALAETIVKEFQQEVAIEAKRGKSKEG